MESAMSAAAVMTRTMIRLTRASRSRLAERTSMSHRMPPAAPPTAQMMQSTGVAGRLTASAAAMPQVIWALPSMGSPPFRAYFTLNVLVQG